MARINVLRQNVGGISRDQWKESGVNGKHVSEVAAQMQDLAVHHEDFTFL